MQAGAKRLTNGHVCGPSAAVVGGCGKPVPIPRRKGHPPSLHPSRPGRGPAPIGALSAGIVLAAWLSVTVPAPADASPHSQMVCTVSQQVDPDTGDTQPVTTCIHTERGPGFTNPPATLDVQIASTGCFYLGSRPTKWVHLGYDDHGRLEYGWSPDGRSGGHTVIGTAEPCSWPEVEGEEIEGYVWSRIESYVHQSPQVSFDPPVPWGMAGIETFAALAVPAPWAFSSTSPYTGASLRAGVGVERVRFDWDDGPRQVFGPSDYPGFTGFPDGIARHTYQTKSCRAPGRRCREAAGDYRIRTAFIWSGWYELGVRRNALTIPNTSSRTDYPVREMVSLVVDG